MLDWSRETSEYEISNWVVGLAPYSGIKEVSSSTLTSADFPNIKNNKDCVGDRCASRMEANDNRATGSSSQANSRNILYLLGLYQIGLCPG